MNYFKLLQQAISQDGSIGIILENFINHLIGMKTYKVSKEHLLHVYFLDSGLTLAIITKGEGENMVVEMAGFVPADTIMRLIANDQQMSKSC